MSLDRGEMLTPAAEMARHYQVAIKKIVAGTVSSYSIGGQSFTKQDLPKLQEGLKYWRRQATRENYGCRLVADVRSSEPEEVT